MFKRVLKILAAGAAALILSAVFLARNIASNLDSMSMANGDWRIIVDAGSANAGVMQKASVAMGGLVESDCLWLGQLPDTQCPKTLLLY